ncbi:GNAT family N-acetyltransferase [Paenibacillus sp. MMS20-IR301]|uniref:GNAT family N-acetyltransferase n=1 Tax=Paenibacillus sp. MMS20-IR301 TaxID=2895946 RepID=UPI0028F1316A|nr:GNAT family N-acetyltransferase [Paenibacillus sp. MMS20-IR301]WNS42404.1 GNAT family N-acetyltransferase [Paenibacillus sp. MMS20-IR301]
MNVKFRRYRTEDFIAVRDMLVAGFAQPGTAGNWMIDRWNFCRAVSHTMHNTYDTWESTVGVWTDDKGMIAGVVNSEGEERGEAFFQVRFPLTSAVYEEMFDFAEHSLAMPSTGGRVIRIRIPAGDAVRESIAQSRGYRQLDWDDTLSMRSLQQLEPVKLPPGYRIRSGTEVTGEAKALAHARAFGYYEAEQDHSVPLAFERMKQAPDYRPELDLSVVDASGEVVSFCTLWYDGQNRHGILEPVGTIPAARKQGLARAAIQEGLHRIAAYGAESAYVGSTMDFYKRLGFEPAASSYVWEKVLEPGS